MEVSRSGSTGMDAGRAAIGPWMARRSVPTERDRSEGHLSEARAVRGGGSALVTLLWSDTRLLQSDTP